MKTQWIFYGLEKGSDVNKFYITTQEMTEREFLDKYGDCENITHYYPVKNLTMEKITKIEKFSKKDIDNSVFNYLKQKFKGKDVSKISEECEKTGINIELVAKYVKYRIEIKKPIKTIRPIKSFIRKLVDAKEKGYSIEQVVDIMMDNEWATFELEWIDRKIPKKSIQASLAEFGFNQVTQGLLK